MRKRAFKIQCSVIEKNKSKEITAKFSHGKKKKEGNFINYAKSRTSGIMDYLKKTIYVIFYQTQKLF